MPNEVVQEKLDNLRTTSIAVIEFDYPLSILWHTLFLPSNVTVWK